MAIRLRMDHEWGNLRGRIRRGWLCHRLDWPQRYQELKRARREEVLREKEAAKA